MSQPNSMEGPRASNLPWPVAGAAVPFLYAWIAWWWWTEVRTQLAALPESPTSSLGAMAAAVVAARVPSLLSEAGVYTLWWKLRSQRLPYWRFTCWIAAFSTIDLLGFTIRRAAEDAPQALHLAAAVLAGPGADGAAARGSGSAAAFGNLGLLTLLRVAMTAWAQWRGIGRGPAGPLLVTFLAWLVARVIAWWSVDLLRGLSPVP